MNDDELLASLRNLLYDLEDENAITCRDRGEVAWRIVRLLNEREGAGLA